MKIALLLTANFLLGTTLSAQQPAAGERRGITFQVVTPSRTAPTDIKYLPPDTPTPVPLVFNPANLSERYRYVAAGPIAFFTEISVPGQEAPIRKEVGTFLPSPGVDAFILIFVKADKSGLWEIRSIPRNAETMAPAAISFYNALGARVQAQVGDKASALKAGVNPPQSVAGKINNAVTIKQQELNPATGKMVDTSFEGFNEGVRVVLTRADPDSKRSFYDANIPISPAQSYMMLIFPPEDPRSRNLRIKLLSVVPPPSQPAPAQ